MAALEAPTWLGAGRETSPGPATTTDRMLELAPPDRCPRDSGWCDGRICRDHGIDCPFADELADLAALLDDGEARCEACGAPPGAYCVRGCESQDRSRPGW